MRWRTQVALICAALLVIGFSRQNVSRVEFLQEYIWDFPTIRWFGGISTIETFDNGTRYLASTDKGLMFRGPVLRHETGEIRLMPPRKAWGLLSSRNTRLPWRLSDTEGMAIAPDGSVFVAFETVARVARYIDTRGPSEIIPRPLGFRDLPNNGGIEALAMDTAGTMYAIPERFSERGRIPVFRRVQAEWSDTWHVRATPWLNPVGADVGPDGRLYLLERGLNFLGFRSRLRRWEITETGLENEEILMDTRRNRFGNLEGLDVWRDEHGALRALLVEDNNFWPFNKTSVVDIRLPE